MAHAYLVNIIALNILLWKPKYVQKVLGIKVDILLLFKTSGIYTKI